MKANKGSILDIQNSLETNYIKTKKYKELKHMIKHISIKQKESDDKNQHIQEENMTKINNFVDKVI